jgi:hypothetical protein
MSSRLFGQLRTLRERREQRAREEVHAHREAERRPRAAVAQAQGALENERAARQTFAARWSQQGGAASSVADQMAGRACLGRLDQEVDARQKALGECRESLAHAEELTAQAAARLSAARVEKEKSEHSAERHRELEQRAQLCADEEQVDEESEVQTMSRAARRQS